jgi:hypothetical protein
MRRLVVFETQEQLQLYVNARSEHVYKEASSELFFGDDVDVLAVITTLDDARRFQGQTFVHILYKYMAPVDVTEFLASRIK